MKYPPHFFYALILAGVIFAIDQVSKELILGLYYAEYLPYAVTSFFNIVFVLNQGISFGMFSQHDASLLLAAGASVIVLVLIIWLWRAAEIRLQIALSLLVGGAVGNIVDRIRHGAVIDFLDMHVAGYHWPAFNVADSAILIGVAVMLWSNFTQKEGSA